MKPSRSTRVVAATLITGSALFGMAPIASADEKPGPKKPTTQTSQERRAAPEPPAGTPKWIKRIVKNLNKFMDAHPGAPKYEPGKTNIMCRLQNKC